MNRWNRKGTVHAKIRMDELRARKAHLATVEASKAWCERNGIAFDRGWLKHAIEAGYPHATGLTEAQKKAWFDHGARTAEVSNA